MGACNGLEQFEYHKSMFRIDLKQKLACDRAGRFALLCGNVPLVCLPTSVYDLCMSTKLVDNKGRVMLGSAFAGRMVIIDDADPDRVIITPAIAIPEREAWLYKNEEALRLVREGLEQARKRQFSKEPPDLNADAALADTMPD